MEKSNAQELDLQDVSIVLAIQNNNPAILTPDLLRGSGIVPTDWEIDGHPVFSPDLTQVGFKNGITVNANQQAVIFGERLPQNKSLEELEIPRMVSKYLTLLPHLDYHAIGINPIRFVTFENRSLTTQQYIMKILLAEGSWQKNGLAPMQAELTLFYKLEQVQLRLNISEVKLKLVEGEVPAIMFAGNFHYAPCRSESEEERLDSLQHILKNCHTDLTLYRDLLDKQFLVEMEPKPISVFSATTF